MNKEMLMETWAISLKKIHVLPKPLNIKVKIMFYMLRSLTFMLGLLASINHVLK